MNLSNVRSDAMAIGETVRKMKNHGYRYENREGHTIGIFLVIDEFAALRIALDKNLLKSMSSLRKLFSWVEQLTFILSWHLQRPETSVFEWT